MIIAFILMGAAVIMVFLYGVLVATHTEEDQYMDDWAQAEWCRERGKEKTDGTEKEEA